LKFGGTKGNERAKIKETNSGQIPPRETLFRTRRREKLGGKELKIYIVVKLRLVNSKKNFVSASHLIVDKIFLLNEII